MKKKLIVLSLIILFLLDMIFIQTDYAHRFDTFVYEIVIFFKGEIVTNFFKLISFLASTKFILLANFAIILFIIMKKKLKLLIIGLFSLSSVIVNHLVKLLVKRDRPLNIALIEETFYSFPSGHSMIAVLFYGSIIYILREYRIKHYQLYSVCLVILIFLVGISRIYLGVHFATDIIGGYLLGSIILVGGLIIKDKLRSENI